MGLLTLVAAHGVTMTVVCDGDDAAAAVAALAELVATASGKGSASAADGEAGGRGRVARASRSASRTCSASRVEIHERRIAAEQVEAELRALRARRCCETDAQLARIQAQIAEREGDEQQYRILEAHRLMLSDVHLVERARKMIRDDKAAAEWAVRKALDQIQAVFERIEDPYFRDRKSDVALVGERLLRNLVGDRRLGVARGGAQGEHRGRARAVARRRRSAGARGGRRVLHRGRRAHLAHRDRGARARACPTSSASRGCGHKRLVGHDDGHRRRARRGDPRSRRGGAAPLRGARRGAPRRAPQRLAAIRDVAAQTVDGTPIHLHANVEMLEEIPIAVDLGAESVGLFRTEFLYLERADLPDRGRAVRARGRGAQERRRAGLVTFRTLDLGGDKLPPSVRIPERHQPGDGAAVDPLLAQARGRVPDPAARALPRGARSAPMRILFPLISGVAELRAAKQICAEVRDGAGRARACRTRATCRSA